MLSDVRSAWWRYRQRPIEEGSRSIFYFTWHITRACANWCAQREERSVRHLQNLPSVQRPIWETARIMSLSQLRKKAIQLGATNLHPSTRKNKKWVVLFRGKWIHFGARGMSDYTLHKDPKRRARYRLRHSKIRLKNGKLAYRTKTSPSFWSYNLLWWCSRNT